MAEVAREVVRGCPATPSYIEFPHVGLQASGIVRTPEQIVAVEGMPYTAMLSNPLFVHSLLRVVSIRAHITVPAKAFRPFRHIYVHITIFELKIL
jgi:hypothetical protein